jgi:hypothetical protein
MRIRSVFLIALIALIGLPAASPAAVRFPTFGAADGVTATLSAGHVEFRLVGAAAAAASRYVGRRLDIQCSTHPRPSLLFSNGGGTSENGTEAPVVREANGTLVVRPLGTIATDTAFDVCVLNRPPGERRVLAGHGIVRVIASGARPPLARAALTPAGAVWVEELDHVFQIYDVVWNAQMEGAGYPLPAVLAAQQPGIFVLDSAAASPPPGQVGYWSDGAGRAALVAVTGAGRRLVSEDQGEGMLRSNVDDFAASYVAPGPRTEIDAFASDADRDRTDWKRGTPVNGHDGVRATVTDHHLSLRFGGRAAAAYRRIAGRRVTVLCSGPLPVGLFKSGANVAEAFHAVTVRVPRHGGVVRARVAGATDLCVVSDDGHTIASVAGTATGRAIVADFEASLALISATEATSAAVGATSYRSAADLAKRIGHGAVALSGPDAPVARGRIGVWTDSAQRMLLATTSSTGRRLIWADDGDAMIRGNAFSTIAGALLLLSFD